MSPYRDTRPYVGLNPMRLQNAPGSRIDPPVSLPNATAASSAATAAAEPPLDPPGTRSRSYGLRVTPSAEFSHELPIANSSMFVLPTGTQPASSRRPTAVAVYGATQCSRILLPHVVRVPVKHILSLTAIGTPAIGRSSPARTR